MFTVIKYQFIRQELMSVKQQQLSDRAILFNRVKVTALADRLSRNMEKLNQTDTRLSFSRCHSNSSSPSSLKRANSMVNFSKNQSKARLLKNIADKLKQSRISLGETPPNISDNNGIIKRENQTTSRKQKTKLEQMLKSIKKCNQMSTKAVHSIKKNIGESLQCGNVTNFTPLQTQQSAIFDQRAQQAGKQRSNTINLLFAELISLKNQMSRLKEDNANLVQIIKRSYTPNLSIPFDSKNCVLCGCNCQSQKIKSNGLNKIFNYP